jgi:transposase
MTPPPSHPQDVLPDPGSLNVEQVISGNGRILIVVAGKSTHAICPLCGRISLSVHSKYVRLLRDLPWHGIAVLVKWKARRFRCRNPECCRKVFAERLPAVAARHGRETSRCCETLQLLGYMLGGEAAGRLADRLGLQTSPDTILRRVKHRELPEAGSLAVVGVDEWAWRKRHRYGTILVDLEKHRLVDVLPKQSATGLADWLKAHLSVQVVSRDRCGVFAEGAREGAPQALQVADRFHLLMNLGLAVERTLEDRGPELHRSTNDDAALATLESQAAPITQLMKVQQQRLQRKQELYNQVIELNQQGVPAKIIAQVLHMGERTVRRWLAAGQFPAPKKRWRTSRSDRFRPYIEQRWNDGCRNILALWREIKDLGYPCSYVAINRFIKKLGLRRQSPAWQRPTMTKAVRVPPRQTAWLISRHPNSLKPEQKQLLDELRQSCPDLRLIQDLVQDFYDVFRSRQPERLHVWRERAYRSPFPALRKFATGLRRDWTAIVAAASLHWSNGQVEGQVHRLKLIKRQMYGRAGFQLLRSRVLPYVPLSETATAPRAP